MKKAVLKFSPHKTAITLSLVMALSSLLFIIPMVISFSLMPSIDANGNSMNMAFPIGMIIAMPFFYLIIGYLFTALGAWIYNQVAKFTGGIQFELVDENDT